VRRFDRESPVTCRSSFKGGCRLRPDDVTEVLADERADSMETVSASRVGGEGASAAGCVCRAVRTFSGFELSLVWPEDGVGGGDFSRWSGRGSWLASDGLWTRRDFSVAFAPFRAVSARPHPIGSRGKVGRLS
jgi:hypothetical protein